MAERPDVPNDPEPSDRPLGDREADEGISELQARLNELQRSVELLGTQGVWASRERPDGRRAPAPQSPPVQAPYVPSAESALPVPPIPPASPPYADPIAPQGTIAPPPPQPPVHPPVPAPSTAPDVADRFGDEPGISDPEASVAMVDAGPFSDLVELRHFEDDLSSLTAVHDVRVRRYGQGRAMIEVGMVGPYDLTLELPRLGLPMDVAPAGPNELIIEFAPLPSHGPEVEAPAGAGEGDEESD